MNPLAKLVERKTGLRRRRGVSIDRLRCNIKPIAESQGFSGRPITHFPVCRAFQIYLDQPAAGVRYLTRWYHEQVFERQVWRYSKKVGGMRTGSLAQAVERLHRERDRPWRGFETASRDLVEAGIEDRVEAYFRLLDSIRRDGFRRELRPPILCWPRGRAFVLIDGHHRVAALHALGHRDAPVEILAVFRLRRALWSFRRRWDPALRAEGGR